MLLGWGPRFENNGIRVCVPCFPPCEMASACWDPQQKVTVPPALAHAT